MDDTLTSRCRSHIADARRLRCSDQFGSQVVAAVGTLVSFYLHWMRLFPGVVSHSRHLPGNLAAGFASRDLEVPSGNFLGNVKVSSRGANRGELITEVFVDDLEPIGKLHHRLARSVEHDVTAVKIQDLRRLDGRVEKILVCGVQGMIDTKILGSGGA